MSTCSVCGRYSTPSCAPSTSDPLAGHCTRSWSWSRLGRESEREAVQDVALGGDVGVGMQGVEHRQ